MDKPDRYDFKSQADYKAAQTQYNQYVRKKRMNAIVGTSVAVVVGLAALTVIGGSWYTVGEGYRGVQLRNGAVVGTAEPGLGFKMPVIDSVVDISGSLKLALMTPFRHTQRTSKLLLCLYPLTIACLLIRSKASTVNMVVQKVLLTVC
jgi:hypothetical protein